MTVRSALVGFIVLITGCGAGNDRTDAEDTKDVPDVLHDECVVPGDGSTGDAGSGTDVAWEFRRDDYEIVNGWILLDPDPTAVQSAIETASKYGVNHIQLSHGLIMEIEDILGDSPDVAARVDVLNMGIQLAHEHGMKAYVWVHELSGTGLVLCYGPESAAWEGRADAYREGLSKLPGLDGVILMFGSAPAPPWYTLCDCDWCTDNYDGNLLDTPPQDEKIRIVTEQVGGVITGELGKELFVRTFVHEPDEVGWHSDGLASVQGVAFIGMHKGPVQDWQPYNPHHPCMGNVGDHPSVMELDLAGEYYGKAVLPFCAPGYYRFRMRHMWKNKGIGVVARIQRGSSHVLGTPNEVNIRAVNAFLDEPMTPLEDVWDDFIEDWYGLGPGDYGRDAIGQVLKNTFPIRRKSHYALGIWALDKGSDLPGKVELDQFHDRGKMPKWDPDWQEVWDSLDRPDRRTILWLWQEGTEAVDLAWEDRALFEDVKDALEPDDAVDLDRRLVHQALAAEAWRAVDLFIWTLIAKNQGAVDSDFDGWIAWAASRLQQVMEDMVQAGLSNVSPAGPARIQQFLANTAGDVPVGVEPVRPPQALFSPLYVTDVSASGAEMRFLLHGEAHIYVDYGLDIPDYGSVVDLGALGGDDLHEFSLEALEPGRRYVVRLRADVDGMEHRGGDFWIFTPW